MNAIGKIILNFELDNNVAYNMDISGLAQGLYFIFAQTGTNEYCKKVIINHN